MLGASEAGGEKRGVTPRRLPLPSHSPRPISSPFAQLLPAGLYVPVALSNLGRKPFQKAQAWARSPRRTSSGRRLRLTYCCATPVYGGHCGALGSRGSLGSLCKKREGSASGRPTLPWGLGIGNGEEEEAGCFQTPCPLHCKGNPIPSLPLLL